MESTNQMTITVEAPSYLVIELAGCGEVQIDWGDNSKKDAFMLTSDDFSEVCHEYENISECTITISGNDITGLCCPEIREIECNDNAHTYIVKQNKVTALDVSRNNNLLILLCCNGELKELDVSKNTNLQELYCIGNKLTVLDVSNNIALTDLLCNQNSLTALDVSRNTALLRLDYSDNLM
jgi:Leucine-rich repeat (LRR) protein